MAHKNTDVWKSACCVSRCQSRSEPQPVSRSALNCGIVNVFWKGGRSHQHVTHHLLDYNISTVVWTHTTHTHTDACCHRSGGSARRIFSDRGDGINMDHFSIVQTIWRDDPLRELMYSMEGFTVKRQSFTTAAFRPPAEKLSRTNSAERRVSFFPR